MIFRTGPIPQTPIEPEKAIMRRCKTPMSPLALALLVLSSLPLATRAQSPAASDGPSVSLSGFGTVGAAISDPHIHC